VKLAPQLRRGGVEPSALWIFFRHTAHGILGAIRLSRVRAGSSKGIHQLLLSSANPPISDVVISAAIVNGRTDIESISLRQAEHGATRFIILVQMVVSVSKENRQCGLKFE